ncbi:cation diffusion facilitator family transporter [Fluviibacter phosphoraccumulans]|uniref:Cation diffusion facilitator transporter n=1 Tax=Fluviibacter phosphoraccumulans TaxID=1751046 RepID=A0A679I9W2_9RHOO|nr:cation diffusion facilitator family transporter [Fluviibacter phosphoraccumulans]BBU68552.1 cation diffusion facilitator transporter [Fluviibacter phosphoraccumulans]BBU72293.1 cation diffusion facilitator transporter [Fluviibacter phosphoraccumulans]BCA64465.1 cation diffusion facilitator transporter [Fluviibacter phosphoraccumulans]
MSLGHNHAGHAHGAHGHGSAALIDALTGEHASAASNRLVRRSVNVSMGVNIILSILQVIVGWFANSHSLLVDGFHSLSDLLSDVLVLFVARHSVRAADDNHPYGHARLETLATLILGLMLVGIGGAFLYSAGEKAMHLGEGPPVGMTALYVALLALAMKEWLFRYMLRAAEKAKSAMLVANAWHSRSDAASSLVVAIGIGGSLLGFIYADLLAAAIVGALIIKMGWQFSRDALEELVDHGADAAQIEEIRTVIKQTPGVHDLHDLRTRRMADRILVDAHVRVAPRISVSEGHRVAEQVRLRVRAACPEVLDMLVHIDPEDDLVPAESVATGDINRDALERWLNTEAARVWGHGPWAPERIQLHYLNGQVEVEVMLPPMPGIDPEPVVIEHGIRDLQQAAQQAGLPLLSWTVYRRLTAD